tara:strand:- start:12 stop:686 length:675 start_codon:yes stop_codon:yes gene_type:complete
MNWITESVKRSNKLRNHIKMNQIDIFIKDELPESIDADIVFNTFKKLIPEHLLGGVDVVYIGDFDVFREKETNAAFLDGAIYVSNKQDSNQDMIDDIVHELAHSVEERYTQIIYNDETLKAEFVGKRKRLFDILLNYDYEPPAKIKSVYHYDEEIDMYFYKKVGYEAMWNLVNGLFPSPYSATALREYFAIGFENYFMGDRSQLKKFCPVLYSKLEDLEFMEER